MSAGWLKLHRKVRQNPLFEKFHLRSVFIELLQRASYKATVVRWRGATVALAAGDLVVSERALALEVGMTHKAMRCFLDRLEQSGVVKKAPIRGTVRGTVRGTEKARGKPAGGTVGILLSICNWAQYQETPAVKGADAAPAATHGGHGPGHSPGHTEQEEEEFKNLESPPTYRTHTSRGRPEEDEERPPPCGKVVPIRRWAKGGLFDAALVARYKARYPLLSEARLREQMQSVADVVGGVEQGTATLLRAEAANDPLRYAAGMARNHRVDLEEARERGRRGGGSWFGEGGAFAPPPPDQGAMIDVTPACGGVDYAGLLR